MSALELDLTRFQRTYNINVMSPVAMTKAALPHLEKTQGTILFISTVSGMNVLEYEAKSCRELCNG